jgi:hypothetical protein
LSKLAIVADRGAASFFRLLNNRFFFWPFREIENPRTFLNEKALWWQGLIAVVDTIMPVICALGLSCH